MTYKPTTAIKFADSPSIDAFGRLRVGGVITLFNVKQVQSDKSLFFATKSVTDGSSSYDVNRASTFLIATSDSGSRFTRQTRQRGVYQPGKSLFINATAVFGETEAGLVKRVGYFDDNDGVFFEQSGSDTSVVLRSSVSGTPVDMKVSQSAWNIDVFDGTGVSNQTLDTTKAQILSFDLQWLGVGRVRAGLTIDGVLNHVHEFKHANINASAYMSNPNLPVRYEIENYTGTSSSGSLEQICSAIMSEGGFESIGSLRSVSRGNNSITITSGSLVPLVSLRFNEAANRSGRIIPEGISVLGPRNAQFRWVLVVNPDIEGSDNASWLSLTGSLAQYDTSRTTANTLTNGVTIFTGYGDTRVDQTSIVFDSAVVLGTDVDNVSDEVILAVEHFEGGNKKFYGSIAWREIT